MAEDDEACFHASWVPPWRGARNAGAPPAAGRAEGAA